MKQNIKKALAAPLRAPLLLAPLLLGGLGACDPGTQAMMAGASLVTFVHTDKTLGDHVATWAFDRDCSTLSLANGEAYCEDFVSEEELRAAEAAARAELAGTYCYRTLAEVNCFTRPDEMASASQRVR